MKLKSILSVALCSVAFSSFAKPVTIQIVNKDLVPSDPISVKRIGLLEEAMKESGIDVELELVEVPQGGYADKLSLMLFSGKIPDIIYFQGGDRKIADQGVLLDLKDYVKSSKIMQQAMYEHNKKRVENYPYLMRAAPVRSKAPLIRADWLAKLDVSAPETIDDYYNFFKILADSDLDGNGKKDTYAITTDGTTLELDNIFDQAFGVNATWLKDENGQWVHRNVSAQEKEKLAFYRKLYTEGLLDPEYITTKWDIKEQKFYTGRAAVIGGTVGKVVDIYESKMIQTHGSDAKLVVLKPAKSEKGQGFKSINVAKEDRGFAVSAISKNPDIAFKVLEFIATPEGQMIDRLGFEGEHYTKDGDNYALTEKAGTWFENFYIVHPKAWNAPVKLMGDTAIKSLELAEELYVEDNSFIIPEELAIKTDTLNSLYKDISWKIISGKADMNSFEDYVEDWYKQGGKELTEYATKVLK